MCLLCTGSEQSTKLKHTSTYETFLRMKFHTTRFSPTFLLCFLAHFNALELQHTHTHTHTRYKDMDDIKMLLQTINIQLWPVLYKPYIYLSICENYSRSPYVSICMCVCAMFVAILRNIIYILQYEITVSRDVSISIKYDPC